MIVESYGVYNVVSCGILVVCFTELKKEEKI